MSARELLVATAAALTLASCAGEDPAEKAQERVDFLRRNGASMSELCVAERAVQEAYLEKGDDEGYGQAKLLASITCRRADQIERYGV